MPQSLIQQVLECVRIFKTANSIATLCSVKAYIREGERFITLNLSQFAISSFISSSESRVARNLDEDVAKDLKGKKFILLKGEESLDENGQAALERIKSISSDLTDAYILKERLRTIYATAKDGYVAYCLLRSWCSMARCAGLSSRPLVSETSNTFGERYLT